MNRVQPTVLFVSHSKEIGGAEVYLEGLLRYAIRSGIQAQLVCRSLPVLNAWSDRIAAAGAGVHRLDLTSPRDFLQVRRLASRADLVHLMLAYPVGKYQLAAALLSAGTPLIVTHHLVVENPAVRFSAPRRVFWNLAFRSYARLARRNIVPSRAGLELLLRRGFPPERTELIYNGADASRFKPLDGSARSSVRRAMMAALDGKPWPDDAIIICTVARLNPQKGLFDLVDAAAIVMRSHPQARFVIVGDGEQRPSIQERIARLGLGGQVFLAGSRPPNEVAAWLGGCDLFVLSSVQEGLPLALMEAMAAGCPVVATSVGGIPDVVSDSSIGLLVPPAEPRELAQAIGQLVHDGARRQAMAAAARARIVSSFSVEACYERTLAVYRAVMPTRPQHGLERPGP
jgi:glycosyltransferase involved in cell wall biosynthesis